MPNMKSNKNKVGCKKMFKTCQLVWTWLGIAQRNKNRQNKKKKKTLTNEQSNLFKCNSADFFWITLSGCYSFFFFFFVFCFLFREQCNAEQSIQTSRRKFQTRLTVNN